MASANEGVAGTSRKRTITRSDRSPLASGSDAEGRSRASRRSTVSWRNFAGRFDRFMKWHSARCPDGTGCSNGRVALGATETKVPSATTNSRSEGRVVPDEVTGQAGKRKTARAYAPAVVKVR